MMILLPFIIVIENTSPSFARTFYIIWASSRRANFKSPSSKRTSSWILDFFHSNCHSIRFLRGAGLLLKELLPSLSLPIAQQQQQNLLSQANWGRLEMKPKRHKYHGSDTLIASLKRSYPKLTLQGYPNL